MSSAIATEAPAAAPTNPPETIIKEAPAGDEVAEALSAHSTLITASLTNSRQTWMMTSPHLGVAATRTRLPPHLPSMPANRDRTNDATIPFEKRNRIYQAMRSSLKQRGACIYAISSSTASRRTRCFTAYSGRKKTSRICGQGVAFRQRMLSMDSFRLLSLEWIFICQQPETSANLKLCSSLELR